MVRQRVRVVATYRRHLPFVRQGRRQVSIRLITRRDRLRQRQISGVLNFLIRRRVLKGN